MRARGISGMLVAVIWGKLCEHRRISLRQGWTGSSPSISLVVAPRWVHYHSQPHSHRTESFKLCFVSKRLQIAHALIHITHLTGGEIVETVTAFGAVLITMAAVALLIELNHLLSYAIRATFCRGEGVIRSRRKKPFAGFLLVFLLRQIVHGTENYGLVQTCVRMVA
jgi:hypothetical protein